MLIVWLVMKIQPDRINHTVAVDPTDVEGATEVPYRTRLAQINSISLLTVWHFYPTLRRVLVTINL